MIVSDPAATHFHAAPTARMTYSAPTDACVAVVAVDGAYGDSSYADFLSLLRISGVWKIVNKNYVSTGGASAPEGAR